MNERSKAIYDLLISQFKQDRIYNVLINSLVGLSTDGAAVFSASEMSVSENSLIG